MYTSDEEAILDKLAGMYDLSESQMIFAKQWLQLPATAKDAVVDYIVSVASALQKKKAQKMMCQSLTHRKMVILIIWIAAISLLLQLGKTQPRQLIIPAQRV